jgi:2-polyprenyl-6-hydroxyphenyl methylase / 3-demethylubiquinone-9 3-methyltransferase
MTAIPAHVVAEPLYDREDWWNPRSRAFRSLRSVSAFRFELLQRWLGTDWRGRTVVDLGCGGGFLTVPLVRAGARVIGVDVAPRALRSARRELGEGWVPVVGDLAAPPIRPASADVVILADVLEHVADPKAVVAAAAALLRPGGHLFVNTIARTLQSRWFAIRLAEGLGYVPAGTHRWEQFVTPEELRTMGLAAGLDPMASLGERPSWWRTLWSGAIVLRPSRSMALGYAMLFKAGGE